jgi:hypothetical protein
MCIKKEVIKGGEKEGREEGGREENECSYRRRSKSKF